MKANLIVEGMSCGGCAKKVETSVNNVGAECEVNLASKSVAVEFDENKVTLDGIKEAINKTGYKVKE
ncbi:cation transporter [Paenibacillus vini]|uniref:heavy-metal-associated domain-containing protein n=1 Tax=Paenibacillus vini TaxID=1476024 RepID=UPI0025B6D36C|nr:cation transporter [Paenibacillus vini]MDN4067617.1 cation transporter [Paenibacillus vini]